MRVRAAVLAAGLSLLGWNANATCSLPYTFSNGVVADATQVNADLSALAACIAAVSSNLGAASATSLTVSGTITSTGSVTVLGASSVFQVGGLTGPFMSNDGALDTISFQALNGALPSGNTTNVQIYPPAAGQKAFLNITALASLSPAGEERLLIGTLGHASDYVFTQVATGTGLPRNVDFLDGGASGTPAFILVAGNGTTAPSLAISQGQSMLSSTASNGFQALLSLDNSLNEVLGGGANILSVTVNKNLVAASGGLTLASATPTVTAGKVGLGTTTATSASCGSIAGGTACLAINVGGTTRYIPYF